MAPIHRRLVLFWSDARCPHEVLPAHDERFAVSIWFSLARDVAEALKAEAAAAPRPPIYVTSSSTASFFK